MIVKRIISEITKKESRLWAMQHWCQPPDWQNGLIFFFGCLGSGGSGGGCKPWQRAAIAHSRNLPTNPCLWLALWRYVSLLDISCQLALGTVDSILLVQSLYSNCLRWCRRYKPLQCHSRGCTKSLILKVNIKLIQMENQSPHILIWHVQVRFKVLWCNVSTLQTGKQRWYNAHHCKGLYLHLPFTQ